MAFDQTTRKRLEKFVGACRGLLVEEFTRQLQLDYGLDPATGRVTEGERSRAVDANQEETGRILRELMGHYLASDGGDDDKARQKALDRIVREQAFTVLNRLCAIRMAEARGFVVEAVAKGYESKGFQLYVRVSGTAVGEAGDAYRHFLFSLFDECAVDLPVLFDRFSPQSRLFPREVVLRKLLDEINHAEIEPLWAEDETIGWIYQYFNSADERRKMRADSQAPRDSRELAVRNQFFTPRFVVEFLADNTLGRIWYEMLQGQTRLRDCCRFMVRRRNEVFLASGEDVPEPAVNDEDLLQEELLAAPLHVPFRARKDPRELKILDPACGSGHFLLYSFDLLERMYEEAWDLQSSGQWTAAAPGGSDGSGRLLADFPCKDDLLRAMPLLIIENNLHGIEIDPRCAQIAGLSLWLRAQKTWKSLGVKAQDRPSVQRSYIVVAEPMPGEVDMLDDFLKGLRRDRLEDLIRSVLRVPEQQQVRATERMADALCDLVRTVWNEMKVAGEMGSLLKIDETLAEAVAQGKEEWEDKMPLFRVAEFGFSDSAPKIRYLRTVPGEEQDFWDRAEVLVLGALERYAELAIGAQVARKRMFAEDAAQGFALVDICRKRFDVVLMNPPFGEFCPGVRGYAESAYPNTNNDIFAAFVERSFEVSRPAGMVGAITSRTGFFLTSFAKWREHVLQAEAPVHCLADLGLDVMDDAMVEAAAYCLRGHEALPWRNPYIRLLCEAEREGALEQAAKDLLAGCGNERIHLARQADFKLLPETPFVYWVPTRVLRKVTAHSQISPALAEVRQGLATADDPRFARAFWEVPPLSIRTSRAGAGDWVPYIKGGSSQPWFAPVTLLVNWRNEAAELWANVNASGKIRSNIWMLREAIENSFFRPGFSWTRRAVRFIPYVTPDGAIPSASRYVAYPKETLETILMGAAASNVASAYLRFYGEMFQRPNYMVEVVKTLPWAELGSDLRTDLESLVKTEIQRRRAVFAQLEPYQEFKVPTLLCGTPLEQRDLKFDYHSLLGPDRDERVGTAFGLDADEQTILTRDLIEAVEFQHGGSADGEAVGGGEDDDDADSAAISPHSALWSYLVGCAFGRWDARHALTPQGLLASAGTADVCSSLPRCPAGMLQDKAGAPMPATDLPSDYPFSVAWSGIMVQEPGHSADLVERCLAILRTLRSEGAERLEQESCAALAVEGMRDYFDAPSGFFDDHLGTYTKSRRYAPIYWPLSTANGSYTLWLYYHRLSNQTLYTCLNEFVDPKLKQVAEDSRRLRAMPTRSSAQEKELEDLTDLQAELKDFRDELLRLAEFWNPNLNDGVLITAAPLWKLFLHREWRKRLRDTWQQLEGGEFYWAHLALSIWPERVVKASHKDRSFAIAHGLEDDLWEEVEVEKKTKGGKVKKVKVWQPKPLTEAQLNALVAAVKAR